MERSLPPGTKHDILKLLLRQELDVQALAGRLGVSAAAVRQHLDTLRALGLIVRRKLPGEPGRPTYLYRLSPDGQRVFPKRYDLLLGLLVEALIEHYGVAAMGDVVGAAARRLAERVRGRFAGLGERARWGVLLAWLEEELAWEGEASEAADGSRRVVIHHCPFQDVSTDHPQVCGVFFRTLVQALYGDVPVEHRPERPSACCSLTVGSLPPRAPPA